MSISLPKELNKYNIPKWIKNGGDFSNLNGKTVDISMIDKIDSAGIALLLELKQKYQVSYCSISDAVAKLANLYQIKL
ncbi:STAS domain-containing protein [Aquella oligotrophica]|uniref:STAS domain-containing protein n=1 Tax=Aquella oligotrophica TaxID=2067065 RepID=A0A2I7N4A6_9NEIS|nr:hypothetical protein [Aquella oligotrophica]AUR51300.1 hypothetical protein CUN60_02945 [Aquella oligotrophica]